jgi:hypothetical protein
MQAVVLGGTELPLILTAHCSEFSFWTQLKSMWMQYWKERWHRSTSSNEASASGWDYSPGRGLRSQVFLMASAVGAAQMSIPRSTRLNIAGRFLL